METSSLQFRGEKIPLYFITERCERYQTPKYNEIMGALDDSSGHMEWKQALEWFLNRDRLIPLKEKVAIQRIGISQSNRVFCVETGASRVTYQHLSYLAHNTGWYFYLTGVNLGRSPTSYAVDQIPVKYTKKHIEETWDTLRDGPIELIDIGSGPNSVCFLLKIGSLNILLDAGLPRTTEGTGLTDQLRELVDHLDGIFLSHAHSDHCQGLALVLQAFPDAVVLCSSTTLDFLAFKEASVEWGTNETETKVTLSDSSRKLVTNTVRVASRDRIQFAGGDMSFFAAGHMPGALMLHIKDGDYGFLYTGDFSLFDYFPIQGVYGVADSLPKRVDFALIDAAMCNARYSGPEKVFTSLFRQLKKKADFGNHVLIGADPASTAIVLYVSIFNYFRGLQLKTGYEHRPLIVLGRDTLEYVRIIQQRAEDLHPVIRRGIDLKLNPFSSALACFCEHAGDVWSALEQNNAIFIFGPPDFNYGIIQDLLGRIGTNQHNLVYLAGALRSSDAIELASGMNQITLKGLPFTNQAEVFNVQNPDETLNLHADFLQIAKLVEMVRPRRIALFHSSPKVLVPVRAEFSRLTYVSETHSFSATSRVLRLR